MTKSILALVGAVALLSGYAHAECNNMCSGHGNCGGNDMCTCYRNWRGNDCSERTCQYGVSFVDTPQGDLDHNGKVGHPSNSAVTQWAPSGTFERYPDFAPQEAHSYMECSNKGMCDRATGECVCFDGYEGSACQRTVCPNSCSGHGVCRNVFDVTKSVTNGYDYPLWDGLKNQACVCDAGYQGYDCSQRKCPRGADPLFTETEAAPGVALVPQVQTITVGHASADVTGTIQIAYKDVFGETWITPHFTVSKAALATSATNLKAALKAIPNNVIPDVTVVDAVASGSHGILLTVTFSSNPGNMEAMSLPNIPGAKTGTITTVTGAITTPGTKLDVECSGRGLCDYDTGLCKCFRGYRLADCSSQHALAFGSTTTGK